MKTALRVLDSTGDTPLIWDAADPARCAEIREIVADLKRLGYSFFLVSGQPADEVSAGAGSLLVRRLTADEVAPAPVVASDVADPPEPPELPELPETSSPRRRGRPPKARPTPPEEAEARNVVAVRPIRGGCHAR